MPNYCMNKLELVGDQKEVAQLLKWVKGPDNAFDFQRIIPMPESIKDTERGSISFASEAVCLYLQDKTVSNHLQWLMERNQIAMEKLDATIEKWEKEKKIDLAMGYRIIANRLAYNGCGDWYEWCIENWGTKWEACETEVVDNVINFETAWSPCTPIVEKLAELFPEIQFIYTYFEPGVSLAGIEKYQNGDCVELQVYEQEEKEYRYIGEGFGYEFENDNEENNKVN